MGATRELARELEERATYADASVLARIEEFFKFTSYYFVLYSNFSIYSGEE